VSRTDRPLARLARTGIAAALALSLSACFGDAPPVPEDNYYRITLAAPPERSGGPLLAGVVLVEPFDADGLLRDRALVYSGDDPAGELKQHHYHFWTDAPPRLLQEATASYLRRAGIAESVVTPELRVPADLEVQGHLLRLERLLGGDVPRVAVELRLALVQADDGRLVAMNDYADEVACADDSVSAAVAAFNQALSGIYARFLADIERAAP
jgi:ABC-type uncharacterized transport system auxiliary subunit